MAKALHIPMRLSSRHYSTITRFLPVSKSQDSSIEHFKNNYFTTSVPVHLPRQFLSIPALSKWTVGDKPNQKFNIPYLSQYGDHTVPLEADGKSGFRRFETRFPLSLFLEWAKDPSASEMRLYLAQHSIISLPPGLQEDLPIPAFVQQAGRGDVYDSSIWLGLSPTFTPLHRDPNPNLFVQLAGTKVIRLLKPETGRGLYERIRMSLREAEAAHANMRGEEMMYGAEKNMLETEVWDDKKSRLSATESGLEAILQPGDALFIPLGWWHSVKGIGDDEVNISANWWFR